MTEVNHVNLFTDTSHSGADLRGADMAHLGITDAWFTGCDLRGADMRGAEFDCVSFRGADMRGVKVDFDRWHSIPGDVFMAWARTDDGYLDDNGNVIAREFVNLTPHEVSIVDGPGQKPIVSFPASGTVARVDTSTIEHDNCVDTVSYGTVAGLPEFAEGTVYIVSLVTLLALHGSRSDVVAPWQDVRDSQGRIVGCQKLQRLA